MVLTRSIIERYCVNQGHNVGVEICRHTDGTKSVRCLNQIDCGKLDGCPHSVLSRSGEKNVRTDVDNRGAAR